MIDSKVKQLTVREFLSNGQYVIPIYQRNYDWGERETLQLLEDISDYAQKNSNQKYYIGSAVVFVRNVNGTTYFEMIDGQQRLTTLRTHLIVIMRPMSHFKSIEISLALRPERRFKRVHIR